MSDDAIWPLACDLSPYDALMFDLDGTLVDTMPLHCRAYAATFAARGYEFGMADYLAHVGPPARITIPAFAAAAGMPALTDDQAKAIHRGKKLRFAEILAAEKADLLPSSALLDRYRDKKPMALVSSGNRDGVRAILRAMGWQDWFGAVITGDEVSNGKPHPEPYLAAARALGVPPHRAVAFEDAESGIESALAAGMTVIDVSQAGSIQGPRGDR